MKKIFLILTLLVFALSCGKKGGNQELGILTQFVCLLRRYEKGRLKTLYIGFQTTFTVS